MTNVEFCELLKDSIEETSIAAKGQKFEFFFENFMAQQDGFVFVDRHCRSKVGEIDYFYRNQHKDHPLWKSYDYVFIECKNWKDKISSKELNHFIMLLKAKNIFKCVGIYLTTNSLSPEAHETVRASRRAENVLVIPLEKSILPKLIESGFKTYLEKEFDKIVAKA